MHFTVRGQLAVALDVADRDNVVVLKHGAMASVRAFAEKSGISIVTYEVNCSDMNRMLECSGYATTWLKDCTRTIDIDAATVNHPSEDPTPSGA